MNNEVEQTLRGALVLIQRGWCQGYEALDEVGNVCDLNSLQAVRFCAIGAIYRANYALHGIVAGSTNIVATDAAIAEVAAIVGVEPGEIASEWNDVHGRVQAEVIDAFERAIENVA